MFAGRPRSQKELPRHTQAKEKAKSTDADLPTETAAKRKKAATNEGASAAEEGAPDMLQPHTISGFPKEAYPQEPRKGKYNYTIKDGKDAVVEVQLKNRQFYLKRIGDKLKKVAINTLR